MVEAACRALVALVALVAAAILAAALPVDVAVAAGAGATDPCS